MVWGPPLGALIGDDGGAGCDASARIGDVERRLVLKGPFGSAVTRFSSVLNVIRELVADIVTMAASVVLVEVHKVYEATLAVTKTEG